MCSYIALQQPSQAGNIHRRIKNHFPPLELAAQQLQSTASKKRADYVQDDQSLRCACLFKQTFSCFIHILSFVCAPALFSSLLSAKLTLVSPHKGAAYCSPSLSFSLSLLSPSLTQCCTGGGWEKRALTSAAHCISAPPNKNTDKPINNQMHHEELKIKGILRK